MVLSGSMKTLYSLMALTAAACSSPQSPRLVVPSASSAVPLESPACVLQESDNPLLRKVQEMSYLGCLENAKLHPCDRIPDARESYLCHYPERPAAHTNVRRGNVLTIETHGNDLVLEDYLRPGRVSIVELGYYWCGPCVAWKHQIGREAPSFPDIDFVTVGLSYPGEGEKEDDFNSPAVRYVDGNGGKGVPFFLVYRGRTLLAARQGGGNNLPGSFEGIVQELLTSARDKGAATKRR